MRVITCFLFILLLFQKSIAQDINFSQFYELPLLRNPALSGLYSGDYRVTSAFRNQWASVTTPYKTVAIGAESKIPVGQSANYFSVGCQVTHDQAGDSKLSKTQVLPLLVFLKSVDPEKDGYISFGILAGGVQQRFNSSSLRFSDQFINGVYRSSNPTQQQFHTSSRIYWDLTMGIAYSTMVGDDLRFYLGGAYFHLTQPIVGFHEVSIIKLNQKYVFNAGLSVPVANSGRLIIYNDIFIQGGNNQMQAGALYQHTIDDETERGAKIAIGGFYRWNDALVPTIRLSCNKLSAGFSYDVNISKLKKASYGGGGPELTLTYEGLFNDRSPESRLRCPVRLHD